MMFTDLEIAIAIVAHEANRAYCQTIGDNSQPKWANAPNWQVISACNGVRFIMENLDATAAESHNNWMAEKVKDGWTYGPVKDPKKKQHPCMVPFDQLPKKQQAKDALFRAVVVALMEKD